MKIERQKIYIFNRQKHHKPAPFKGKVEDVTLHTYLIKNLDDNTITRYDKQEFEGVWEVLEEVEGEIIEGFGDYFDKVDNGYIECYLSKDRMFTIQKEVGEGYGLFTESNDLGVKEINSYWTIGERSNLRNKDISTIFQKYLKVISSDGRRKII